MSQETRVFAIAATRAAAIQRRLEEAMPQDADWRPTLPSRAKGDFTMVDFLTFAGVDPRSRGQ